MMPLLPVTLVIPHYAGDILTKCLDAIEGCSDCPESIIVVDDASTDGSTHRALTVHAGVQVITNRTNLGFVGACNRGLKSAQTEYIVLLNDDTEVQEGWLAAIIAEFETNPRAGAVQPKILSAADPGRFDYAGGAGGMMDIFGYPYALGRLFDIQEVDTGQYDAPREIFWASGTAIALRGEAIDDVGLLDQGYGMHMEEIDLCWRLWRAGWSVRSAPAGRVLHQGGATLKTDSYRKMALNHRNGLAILLKNHAVTTLLWVLPIRLLLEALTVVGSLVRGDMKRALAALTAPVKVLAMLPHLIGERRRAKVRKGSPGAPIYRGSIALRWIMGNRTIPGAELQL